MTCEEMDAVTYPDALVKSELSRWVFARIDISKEPGTAKSLDVHGVPAALAMSADGTVLARLEGFFTPEAFARELRAIQEARAAK